MGLIFNFRVLAEKIQVYLSVSRSQITKIHLNIEFLCWQKDGCGKYDVKRCSGHKTNISNRFSDLQYMSLEYQHTIIRLFMRFSKEFYVTIRVSSVTCFIYISGLDEGHIKRWKDNVTELDKCWLIWTMVIAITLAIITGRCLYSKYF